MKFLPIVERELRVASRRRKTYWGRVGVAAVALVVFGYNMALVARFLSPPQVGAMLLSTLTSLAFMYCLVAGLRQTADCLSREKREGTLGLLFLTDLRGFDVVLGKLAASSLNSLYGLLAIVPVLTIPILMGGVTLPMVGMTVVIVLDTLFLSLASGLLASAIAQDERRAYSTAILLLLIPTGIFPLLGVVYLWWTKSPGEPPLFFLAPSPVVMLAGVVSGQTRFWICAASVFAFAAAYLALACWWLPHSWQDKPAGRRRLQWRAFTSGRADPRWRAFHRRLLDVNPFLWLVTRLRFQMHGPWLLLGFAATCWVYFAIRYPADWLDSPTYVVTAIVLHGVFKIWLAAQAGQAIAQDRQSGALELLLATPLSIEAILRGQGLALRRQFLWPGCAVLAVDFCFMYLKADERDWLVIWTAGVLVFPADLITLYWLGMWQALAAKQPSQAGWEAILRVLVVPWVVFLFCAYSVAAFSLMSGGGFFESTSATVGFWLFLSLAFDAYWLVTARRKLHTRFRELATQRGAAGRGALARLGRALGMLVARRRARDVKP